MYDSRKILESRTSAIAGPPRNAVPAPPGRSVHLRAVALVEGFEMPRIYRWFAVSDDINSDPEVWELRNKFGDRAGFIWLEFCAIGHRNGGLVGPCSDSFAKAVGWRCHAPASSVRRVSDHARTCLWLVCDRCPTGLEQACDHALRLRNYPYSKKTRGKLNRIDKNRIEENKIDKRKEEEDKRPQAAVFVLPDWVPKMEWQEFKKMRGKMRKPLGEHAEILLIKDLERLCECGNDCKAVIEQSIKNGWQGLFEIKEWRKDGQTTNTEPKGFDSVRGFLRNHKG